MRKISFLLLIVILLWGAFAPAQAQEEDVIRDLPVRLSANVILRSGPGLDTAWFEYLAANRQAKAIGRDTNTEWIKIKVTFDLEGWVAASSLRVDNRADLERLPIVRGLRDGGGGYPVDDPRLRAVEVEMIRIQRPLLLISDRYFRLQVSLPTSCGGIPANPEPPAIPDAAIQAIPELARVKQELTYSQQELTVTMDVFRKICETEGDIPADLYFRAQEALSNSRHAFTNVRLYLNEIAGLQEGVW